ncbi:MAG: hypothetical protein NTY38_02625 [Acidobacteria bacterium]|nr:hypothetical protein [Acidobacteriota bacterium]
MSSTEMWWWFWVVSFLVSGASFAFIAVVVMFKGVGDLKTMLRLLDEERKRQ